MCNPGRGPSPDAESISTFLNNSNLIHLFIFTVLSLHCWLGFSLVAVLRLLTVVASLFAEHGL